MKSPIINPQSSTVTHSFFLATTRQLLARAPFFAHLLVGIPKRIDERSSLPFAFVWENQPVLLYQPLLLKFLEDKEAWLADWLCEELLHLLLQHPQQSTQYPIKWAFHLAADIEVRQYFPTCYQDHLYEDLRTRLHLDEFADLRTIYAAILRLQSTLTATDILPKWQADPFSRKSHFYWPSTNSSLTWQRWWPAQRSLLSTLGETPAALQLRNHLTVTSRQVVLPWPVILRRFINSAQRSQNRNSLRRPSRRFGTLPGMCRRRTTRLAVVLDTSGSIQNTQRLQFFRELQDLQQYTHEIVIIEADYQVRSSFLFTGEIPPTSKGGGSTAFDPALEKVNAIGPFDGVIYLTDGEGPVPSIKCLSPLLWIICNSTPPTLSSRWPGQITYWPFIPQ